MKLKGKSVKELKRLEKSLEKDIQDTEETIAREEKRLSARVFDGMCWECWNNQLTEESETMFGDVI